MMYSVGHVSTEDWAQTPSDVDVCSGAPTKDRLFLSQKALWKTRLQVRNEFLVTGPYQQAQPSLRPAKNRKTTRAR